MDSGSLFGVKDWEELLDKTSKGHVDFDMSVIG